MSPDSRRSISAASPTSPTRRRTVPIVDVGVSSSLEGRRRNLSDSQLHAVPSALLRYVHSSPSRSGQLHVRLQRKLTAPDIGHQPRRSSTSGSIVNCIVCMFVRHIGLVFAFHLIVQVGPLWGSGKHCSPFSWVRGKAPAEIDFGTF